MPYQNWIKKLEADSRPTAEIQALREYLGESGGLVSPQDAATKLVSYIIQAEEDVENGVLRLWGYIIGGAKEMPEAHGRLVDLLGAIKNLPESMTMRNGKSLNGEWSAGMELWKGLPQFTWEMRECWNHFDPEPSDPEQSKKREAWKNLNSFAARLASEVVPLLSAYAEWELSTALEKTPWDEEWTLIDIPTYPRDRQIHRHSVQKLDGDLPAAAQWIFHYGDVLKGKYGKDAPSGLEVRYVGNLWLAERQRAGSTKTRWDFWRERFLWAADNVDLQEGTRKIAKEAAEKMA